MPTERNPNLFEFARVEGRSVVAAFDGGRITSDTGAMLLGAMDRVIGLTRRLAGCFTAMRACGPGDCSGRGRTADGAPSFSSGSDPQG